MDDTSDGFGMSGSGWDPPERFSREAQSIIKGSYPFFREQLPDETVFTDNKA
jgi:hypothetical protein